MNILNNFSELKPIAQTPVKTADKPVVKKDEYKPDILDFFSEKVVNKNDINDMVTTPRAIFKGYLCFTTGTALNAISAMIKQSKISKALAIAGSVISIYGTYNFVKPFLIREKGLTKQEK